MALLVPIIPLPHIVFFPHTVLPLELFEPRHRDLVLDVVLNGSQIAIPRLDPRRDDDPVLATPVRPIAGIGRIQAVRDCFDGRVLIELKAEGRVRLIEEVVSDTPYRQMLVETIEDVPLNSEATQRDLVRSLLLKHQQSPLDPYAILLDVLHRGYDLGQLADLGSHLLIESSEERQALLEELDPEIRFSRLISFLCDELSSRSDLSAVN